MKITTTPYPAANKKFCFFVDLRLESLKLFFPIKFTIPIAKVNIIEVVIKNDIFNS